MPDSRYSAATDDELAKWISTGDEDAFVEFHSRYSRLLYYRAYHVVRPDHHLAESVTNDVWHIVWAEFRQTRFPHTSYRAWLCTITRNAALSAARQASRLNSVPLDDATTASAYAPNSPSDMHEAVEHCISKIGNPRAQDLVRLRLLQGLDRQEACPQVGYNDLNHCSTVFQKAKESLKHCLKDVR